MTNPVQDLLDKHGIRYIPSGKDFLTKCFNPDHNDTNPSFRIDQTRGIGHCFSCGFKFNIFKHYGVLSSNLTSVRVAKLKEKINDLKLVSVGLELPKGAKPWNTPYRNVSVQTLKDFEAFYTDFDEDYIDRIVFPIKNILGKTSAFVGRTTLSQGNPRYLIRPSNAQINPYPVVLPKSTKSIVLVEGIFDMLNMWDKGARNVVCVFGTTQLYKDTADKLLPYKVAGVEKVFILFDGDDAGRTASEKTKPLIEACGFTVEVIKLPDDMDPGDLTQEYVDSITEYTK